MVQWVKPAHAQKVPCKQQSTFFMSVIFFWMVVYSQESSLWSVTSFSACVSQLHYKCYTLILCAEVFVCHY